MHVFLRDEPVRLEMRRVEAQGLVESGSGLVAMAFYADGNDRPSFRAVLPDETVEVLAKAIERPVHLGLLAEEPEGDGEIRAMVGISVVVEGEVEFEEEEEVLDEPWRESVGDPDAWKGEELSMEEDPGRTALLAFAPLVRLERRHPGDFGEELADLLESALAGSTRPSLEARVEQLLEEL